jgi:hydrogenase/urease accessory protein HupE
MISELLTYVELGFRHITNLLGTDHILFLFALAAIYRLRDWRDVVWVVSAFTIGHSITLALAVNGTLHLPTPVIEFLIPVTIVATGIENIVVRDRARTVWGVRYRPVFAAMFGLVHGAGFANYLRSLFVERIAVPLFGFNIGIELGQLAVLVVTFAAFAAIDAVVAVARRRERAIPTLRLRALAVSFAVTIVAARWAAERYPW